MFRKFRTLAITATYIFCVYMYALNAERKIQLINILWTSVKVVLIFFRNCRNSFVLYNYCCSKLTLIVYDMLHHISADHESISWTRAATVYSLCAAVQCFNISGIPLTCGSTHLTMRNTEPKITLGNPEDEIKIWKLTVRNRRNWKMPSGLLVLRP